MARAPWRLATFNSWRNRTQSTLTLSDGNVITIKHDKPLTDGNFVISAIPTIILAESGSTGSTDDTASEESNRIIGTNRADRLFGADNVADTIVGRNGSDRIQGRSGNDRLVGGNGNDRLFGENDDDVLIGGRGRDRLVGGEGDDTLRGNGGNDRLEGGLGNDLMIGGGGRDRYILTATGGSDTIRGFRLDQDQLRFRGINRAQLDFIQEDQDTLLQLNGEDLATIIRTNAADLEAAFG
ncbi:MAG: calcium-binding protein [Merismopedia sp. SIO2A8]|nr:calcium-binding protein [Merismopedia sp. SIO2A8]